MARIFISYRREESAAWAGRLYDRLIQHFGHNNVFMDVDTIEPGLDFVEVIERTVASCEVLIALIGRQWLTITGPSGQRRLDNPEDFVRLEIATALKRNIRVIPALIQGTGMPHSTDLPEELRTLARRHALEISDTHFHRDVDQFIMVLDRVLHTTISDVRQTGLSDPPPSGPHGETRDLTTPPSISRPTVPPSPPHAPRRGIALIFWGIWFLIISLLAPLPAYLGLIGSSGTGQVLGQLLFFISLMISLPLLVAGVIKRVRG